MPAPQPELSIVVPVYNEVAENLNLLVDRITSVVERLGVTFELVFINDGSAAATSMVLFQLVHSKPNLRLVNLSKNYGECAAIAAGLDHALGNAVINMDSDLQDPPEMIPVMWNYFRQGYDIVFTRQSSRQESFIRRLCAATFYRLLRASTSVDVPVDVGEFRLMSRRAVQALHGFPEKRRFLRGLIPALGFNQIIIPYDREGRTCGQSQYTLKKLVALAFEGFLSLSFSPLFLLAAAALLIAGLGVVCAVVYGNALLGCLLICCGINVLACTIIGAYVAMTLVEVRGRPTYIVSDIVKSEASPIKACAVMLDSEEDYAQDEMLVGAATSGRWTQHQVPEEASPASSAVR